MHSNMNEISICSCVHLFNRFWKRKHFIFISIIVISLVITVAYTGTNLSSLFKQRDTFTKNSFDTKIIHSNVRQWKTINQVEDKFDSNKAFNLNNGDNNYNNLDADHFKTNQIVVKQATVANDRYIPHYRLVHLDLKGARPKLSYLSEIFPLFKKAGANGLLLEFEDVFPFTGDLQDVVASNAFSKDEIQQIIDLAEQYDFELIPLLQTFGHMEYFLKLKHYRHLREVDEFPQAICPSRNESFMLIEQIIDQVMNLFPKSKWLHIGCDEVYHIGMCDRCKQIDRDELFLAYVKKVGSYVKSKYNVAPIIWDDMLRTISIESIKHYNLKEVGVELMIWTYIDDIYRFVSPSQWDVYSEYFNNVWGASAFKGAFGETLTVPNIKMHLDNNIAWLQTLNEQKNNFQNIHGLVITGWQRYDHFATLCELFPSGLPSLIMDLLTVTNGRYDNKILNKFDRVMKCEASYYSSQNIFIEDPNFFSKINCNFPGVKIFRLMSRLVSVQKKVDDYLYDKTIHKAWITDYNVRHNISSPFRINEALQDYTYIWSDLKYLLKSAIESLSEVYDDYTVNEWIEQKIYPSLIRMETFYNNTIQLKKARTWPKRPLNSYKVIERFLDDNNKVAPNNGSK